MSAVKRKFEKLEEQLCAFASDGYTGKGSPDRADAMVWAISDLMLGSGTVQMFPDFRAKRRPHEPANACHVADPPQLKDWWPRWVSATHGYGSAALWWCREPSGRLYIYRELALKDCTPEAFGMEIARYSKDDTQFSSIIPVWMSDKAFDRVQGKSVAVLVADGIGRVLGANKASVFTHTQDERETQNDHRRLQMIEARMRLLPKGTLNVQALQGGKDQTGWDVVRELMRWRGNTPQRSQEPDADYAAHLALTDKAAFREYVDSFSAIPAEVLPVLQISAECPQLIQAMSGAVRSATDESALAQNSAAFVLQALRIGSLAAREGRLREPREEFVERRLDAMPGDVSTMARCIVAARAEQAYDNTSEAEPLSFRRI